MKKIVLSWRSFNEKHDIYVWFLLFYFFAYLPTVSLTTFIAIPSVITKILLILSLSFLIFALPRIIKKILFADLVVVGLFFVLSLFSFVVFENNRDDIVVGIKIFFTSLLFYYVIFRFCQENQKRTSVVSFGSIANIIVLFIVSIVHLRRKQSENMTLCYETLFFASICLSTAFSQKSFNYKTVLFSLATLLGIVTIYIYGSRGPILFIVLLLFISVFLKIKSKKIKRVFLSSIALVIAACFILFFVCMLIYNSGNKYVTKILEIYAKVFSFSGREYLYLIEMNGFSFSPIVGHGLFGDRFLSIGFIFSNPQTTNFSSMILTPYTTYAHNIFIELLVSIGAPLTFLLIAFFIAFFFNIIIPTINDKNTKSIFILPMMITGLCSLLLSNSFAVSNYFWGFLGLCVFIYSNNNYLSSKTIEKNYSIEEQYFELNV